MLGVKAGLRRIARWRAGWALGSLADAGFGDKGGLGVIAVDLFGPLAVLAIPVHQAVDAVLERG